MEEIHSPRQRLSERMQGRIAVFEDNGEEARTAVDHRGAAEDSSVPIHMTELEDSIHAQLDSEDEDNAESEESEETVVGATMLRPGADDAGKAQWRTSNFVQHTQPAADSSIELGTLRTAIEGGNDVHVETPVEGIVHSPQGGTSSMTTEAVPLHQARSVLGHQRARFPGLGDIGAGDIGGVGGGGGTKSSPRGGEGAGVLSALSARVGGALHGIGANASWAPATAQQQPTGLEFSGVNPLCAPPREALAQSSVKRSRAILAFNPIHRTDRNQGNSDGGSTEMIVLGEARLSEEQNKDGNDSSSSDDERVPYLSEIASISRNIDNFQLPRVARVTSRRSSFTARTVEALRGLVEGRWGEPIEDEEMVSYPDDALWPDDMRGVRLRLSTQLPETDLY